MEETEMTDDEFDAQVAEYKKLIFDALPDRFNLAAMAYALIEMAFVQGDPGDDEWPEFVMDVATDIAGDGMGVEYGEVH